jgi:outer membrane protein OmpA-like peptidoglycan-associated protein
MVNTRKSLAYLAAIAALSLTGCSDSGSQTASRQDAQHRFNVYFDVAKSDLTPEGEQVIAHAIAEANRNANTKILVATPESDPKARRDAVQAALVAGGVSPDRIDARWIGPPGSPAPGVRDPRNRVVEISFEYEKSGGGDVASVRTGE